VWMINLMSAFSVFIRRLAPFRRFTAHQLCIVNLILWWFRV
jgi:hypothetical protein